MVSELSEQQRVTIYELSLQGYTEQQIADKTGIPRSTVGWHIRKIEGLVEYRLSELAIKEFQLEFMKNRDAITNDIREITERMQQVTDNLEWIKLHDSRHQRRLDLWKLLGDGQVVMALKKMKRKQLEESQNVAGSS